MFRNNIKTEEHRQHLTNEINKENNQIDFSVVICSWNNYQRLDKTLNYFTRIKVPQGIQWELVLINNNCTDQTDDVVSRYMDLLPIKYIHIYTRGVSNAKNSALEVARGQLIIFTDDDVRPSEDWLNIYWSAYKLKPSGYYFGGPVKSEFQARIIDHELISLAQYSVRGLDWGMEERLLSTKECFIGANWACRMDDLKMAGNFNVNLGLGSNKNQVKIGEETDMMNRLKSSGLKPWYIPELSIIHYVPEHKSEFKHIMDRKMANGYFNAQKKKAKLKRPFIFGVLCWSIIKLIISYFGWLIARLTGQRGYSQYSEFKYHQGLISGLCDNC